MRTFTLSLVFGLTLSALFLAACSNIGGRSTVVSTFARQQAEAGSLVFERQCAVCHGTSLQGTGTGPALRGDSFLDKWKSQTPADLINFIQSSMPPGGSKEINPADRVNLAAYILQTNDVGAGAQMLTATTKAKIAVMLAAIRA